MEINWTGILMKFGEYIHIEEFRNRGLLYMNTQEFFAKSDGDFVRGDKFEGVDQIHQPNAVKSISIGNNKIGNVIKIGPENLAGPLKISFGGTRKNIFCMYSVTEVVSGSVVDERNFEFGDSAIVILNTQEFIDRVKDKFTQLGLTLGLSPVEYKDYSMYSGNTGIYIKSSEYDYQKEFRITVEPGSKEPMKIEIGNLTDITSKILSLKEINNTVSFGP